MGNGNSLLNNRPTTKIVHDLLGHLYWWRVARPRIWARDPTTNLFYSLFKSGGNTYNSAQLT